MAASPPAPPLAPLAPLLRHLPLTLEMARREIRDRYVGQVFGALWALAHPLAMMALYVFVFAHVFKLRIGGTVELPHDYTVYLLSGLVPWLACQEAMTRAATVVVANAGLVKQVVFPLEVLPVKGVLSSMATQVATTALLALYTLTASGFVPATYLLLPLLFALQFLALAGLSYLIAAVSVYFRDVKDILLVLCTAGVYFMPVFYLPAWVPAAARPLLYANPFSHLAWCYQDACYFGRVEHPAAWAVLAGGSLALLYAGHALFARLKTGFGSAL